MKRNSLGHIVTAKCSVCAYRWRVCSDGTIAAHWLYGGRGKYRCYGSRKSPREAK